MRTPFEGLGRAAFLFRLTRGKTLLLATVVLMSGSNIAQSGTGAQVQRALDEVMAVLPAMECDPPEVWTIRGPDSSTATRSLFERLSARGWGILEHGATRSGYAVIADPDPADPYAVAIGGLLFKEVEPGTHAAYITRCNLSPDEEVDPAFIA